MTTIEQQTRFAPLRRVRDRRTCSLEVRNVTVRRSDGSTVLRNVSLEAASGEKICIVGGSNESRQVLVDVLSARKVADDGNVLMNGIDIGILSRRTIRSTTTAIPERPQMIQASIVENIASGLKGISRHQVDWAAEQALVTAFAQYLPNGLDTVIGDGSTAGPIVPSLGQQRRIALARALLLNPDLLVVVEPTSGLGKNEERLVIEALDNVVRGRTLIAVSQRVTVARKVDRVLVLEDSNLAEYNETDTRGTGRDHAKLWRRPTPVLPRVREHSNVIPLRAVPSSPVSEPWGITVGSEIVPGYVATGLLGRTRHADIWAAWSQSRQAPVRVKIPAHSPVSYQAHTQLRSEAKVMSSLRHPGFAECHRFDLEASLPYAVYELLDTPTVEAVAGRQKGLDPLDVFYMGFELAESLNYLHKRGYAHLGLRPRSIQTRSGTVVIMDCAQAVPIGSPIPRPEGSGSGRQGEHTAHAPEKRPDAVAKESMDVYSLGALMHFAAAGRVLSRSKRPLRLVPFDEIVISGPSLLTSMVQRMLAPDPRDRPTTEEILARFRRVLPQSMYRPRVGNLDDAPNIQLVVSNN